MTDPCQHCGLPLDREYAGTGRPPVYCLRPECVRARENKIARDGYWRNKGKYEIYETKTCPNCGEEFVTCKDNKLYCCTKCERSANWKRAYYRKIGEEELFAARYERAGQR